MTEIIFSVADNFFKQSQFGLDDIQGPPVTGDSVLNKDEIAVLAVHLLERSDVSTFVDMDEDVIARIVKQLDQPTEKGRFIVRQDAISVLSHIL